MLGPVERMTGKEEETSEPQAVMNGEKLAIYCQGPRSLQGQTKEGCWGMNTVYTG